MPAAPGLSVASCSAGSWVVRTPEHGRFEVLHHDHQEEDREGDGQ